MSGTNILLLTGGIDTGKTTALKRLLPELITSGILAGGILAPGRYLNSGEKEYDLELLPGNHKFPLSSRTRYPCWHEIGGFHFNPEAIEAGLRHLTNLPQKQYHFYILDEIGPFELDGLLWAPAIPGLMNKKIPMIWTVRNRILRPVCNKWNLTSPMVINLEETGLDRTIERIRRWFEKNAQASCKFK